MEPTRYFISGTDYEMEKATFGELILYEDYMELWKMYEKLRDDVISLYMSVP